MVDSLPGKRTTYSSVCKNCVFSYWVNSVNTDFIPNGNGITRRVVNISSDIFCGYKRNVYDDPFVELSRFRVTKARPYDPEFIFAQPGAIVVPKHSCVEFVRRPRPSTRKL